MPRVFLKMHGLGNDFVILDERESGLVPSPEACRRLSDRWRGVGCDQLVVFLKPQAPQADVYIWMANGDGSLVRACGNATRCVARLLFAETGRREGVIQTVAGFLTVREAGPGLIAADFEPPKLDWESIPLARPVDTLAVPLREGPLVEPCCVNVGNPHAVFFVPDIEAVPLREAGPRFETDPLFPDRANIEFVQVLDRRRLRMRVWERGTGVTQACGSAAAATLVAAVRRGLSERRAEVIMDGGTLAIEWLENDGPITMTGPTAEVFRGTFAPEFEATLDFVPPWF